MNEVTRILSAIEQGDPQAAEQLLPLVYDELRNWRRRNSPTRSPARRSRPPPWSTRPTSGWSMRSEVTGWNSRGHFFAAAAEAMRRILVEAARRKGSRRRGGERRQCELLDGDLVTSPVSDELLDLDEALSKLGSADAQAAELVKLRVFAGMTVEEVAEHLGISPRTAKRSWAYARAWLGRELAVHPGLEP